jgi:ABC transporter with metal-binding/Fe-S-binding domain ATP-binding protein
VLKSVWLLSGGKDSFLAAETARDQGHEIGLALTVIPEEFSLMYHYPNASKAELVAGMRGTPWMSVSEDRLASTLTDLRKQGYDELISGAIASEYQKTRLEKLCTEIGMESFTPLWHKDQSDIIRELILRGIGAIIVSVSAEGFTEKDIGRSIDEDFLRDLESRNKHYGINIAGEGGEYESFVYSAYGCSISISRSHKIWEGSHGYLIIDDAELVQSRVV